MQNGPSYEGKGNKFFKSNEIVLSESILYFHLLTVIIERFINLKQINLFLINWS